MPQPHHEGGAGCVRAALEGLSTDMHQSGDLQPELSTEVWADRQSIIGYRGCMLLSLSMVQCVPSKVYLVGYFMVHLWLESSRVLSKECKRGARTPCDRCSKMKCPPSQQQHLVKKYWGQPCHHRTHPPWDIVISKSNKMYDHVSPLLLGSV
jgi:hypothetical protein